MDEDSDWDPSESDELEEEQDKDLSDSLDDRYKRRQKWLLTDADRKQNASDKDKTEKKKKRIQGGKKQDAEEEQEEILTNEEAEKIVGDLYDISKKDKIEPSKILTDLAKIEPIFDNLGAKYKIY